MRSGRIADLSRIRGFIPPTKEKNPERFKKMKIPQNPGTAGCADGGWLEQPFCLNGGKLSAQVRYAFCSGGCFQEDVSAGAVSSLAARLCQRVFQCDAPDMMRFTCGITAYKQQTIRTSSSEHR